MQSAVLTPSCSNKESTRLPSWLPQGFLQYLKPPQRFMFSRGRAFMSLWFCVLVFILKSSSKMSNLWVSLWRTRDAIQCLEFKHIPKAADAGNEPLLTFCTMCLQALSFLFRHFFSQLIVTKHSKLLLLDRMSFLLKISESIYMYICVYVIWTS